LKRRLSLLAVVALVSAPQLFAGRVWHKAVGPAQKEALAKKQLILVDMFAEWCGWCHRFEREVFPSQVFQDATKDIVLLRLDTEDGKEGTQFAKRYAVTSLPTFLVLAPDLSIAGLLRGYAPPNDFVQSLKDARNQYADLLKSPRWPRIRSSGSRSRRSSRSAASIRRRKSASGSSPPTKAFRWRSATRRSTTSPSPTRCRTSSTTR
jgi:thioredoxin-related protein